ncbi:helix-turn-helix domain-containing protein [Paenibacillus sp. CF384]|uniref:response regulator transcription factor n=1 Tax=Paenibacillus sp. CF384 TaxID=1884382 RepID=UPI00089A65FC|nr:helix-turn-helix domain-containing protein [Paenibacillus sp. CF384]SDX61296.1 two-component system, response regulator YesN [Paenibacillus sp. CF384]
MIKVLLVEDELIARTHIRSMSVWEGHGYRLCGEATNGEAAIRMIGELEPDVILSDVAMPLMDGVALSHYLVEQNLGIPIIMLSSYDSYDYVRMTLNNGAVDYLLKHRLDEASLLSVLEKAKHERLLEQKSIGGETLKSSGMIDLQAKQQIVKELALGHMSDIQESESNVRLNEAGFSTRNLVVGAMSIVHYHMMDWRQQDKDRNLFIRSVLELCQSQSEGIVTHIGEDQFALLFSFERIRSESQIASLLQEEKEKLRGMFSKFMNVQMMIEFSRCGLRLSDIADGYRQAKGKLQSMNDAVLGPDHHSPAAGLSIKMEKLLLGAFDQKDEFDMNALIERIFTELAEQSASHESVRLTLVEMVQLATKVGQKHGIASQTLERLTVPMQMGLRDTAGPLGLKDSIIQMYCELLETLRTQEQSAFSGYVGKAVRFIDSRFRDNISLQLTAEHVGINTSYLSHLFKKETGMSFVEFLNRKRISRAQQLLEEGVSVKAIYEQVGFNTYNYFFKVFKDMTGTTPLDYEKRSSEQSG